MSALAGCRGAADSEGSVLSKCWGSAVPGLSISRPALDETAVYATDGVGSLNAFAKSDGRRLWHTQLTAGVIRGMNVVVASGVAVAATRDSTVGVDAATGRLLWQYAAPLDRQENPVAPEPGYVGFTRMDTDGESVFIPAWGASVSAVDLRTGQRRWLWSTPDTAAFRSGSMGVRRAGDTLYATVWRYTDPFGGKTEQWLVALDRRTGRELWRKTFPPFTGGVSVQGAPVIIGDIVIFSVVGGDEFAVNRFTQQLVWTFRSSPIQATVAESEGFGTTVYHDAGDQTIVALDAATGTLLWKGSYGGQATVDFLVSERFVYVSVARDLVVLDRTNGREVQRIRRASSLQNRIFSSPAAFAEGRIYVAADYEVLCYKER